MSVIKNQQMHKMSKAYINVPTGTAEINEIIKWKEQELFQFHICKSIPSQYTEIFLEAISTY